jgi:hypothetical protein
LKAAFVERFDSSEIVIHLRAIIISFNKTKNELLVYQLEKDFGDLLMVLSMV